MRKREYTIELVQFTRHTAVLNINGVFIANYVIVTEEQRQRACDAWFFTALALQDTNAPRHIDIVEDFTRRRAMQRWSTAPNSVFLQNYPTIRIIAVTPH